MNIASNKFWLLVVRYGSIVMKRKMASWSSIVGRNYENRGVYVVGKRN